MRSLIKSAINLIGELLMETIESRKLTLNPSIAILSGAVGLTTLAVFVQTPASAATGTVPQVVQDAIDNTTATVAALGPVAVAAVAAALIPFGSAMALAFVHKVMAKA